MKFGTDRLFTLQILSEPNLFFWDPCQFHPSRAKKFLQCKLGRAIAVPLQAVGKFTNDFSGPKRFRDFRETGPGAKNSHRFWDRGSTFWVKIWDKSRKNIPRYDPVTRRTADH